MLQIIQHNVFLPGVAFINFSIQILIRRLMSVTVANIQEIHGKILEKLEEEKDIEEEITIAPDGVKEIGKAVFAVNKWIENKYDSKKRLASPSTMYAPVQTRLPKLVLSSLMETRCCSTHFGITSRVLYIKISRLMMCQSSII